MERSKKENSKLPKGFHQRYITSCDFLSDNEEVYLRVPSKDGSHHGFNCCYRGAPGNNGEMTCNYPDSYGSCHIYKELLDEYLYEISQGTGTERPLFSNSGERAIIQEDSRFVDFAQENAKKRRINAGYEV